MNILLALNNTQVIKARIASPAFIHSIATLLNATQSYSFPGGEEFINALLLIAEGMGSNQKSFGILAESILNHLLPALLQKMNSDTNDIRFLSLKVFSDFVGVILRDESIYRTQSEIRKERADQNIIAFSQAIEQILLQQLFPLFQSTLQENGPL